jgi:hypothetical protein
MACQRRGPSLARKLPVLLREVDQDGTRLSNTDCPVSLIDNGRYAIVRRNFKEVRLKLLVLHDVDRMDRVVQPHLFQRDGGLVAVRRAPGVEIDHGSDVLPCISLDA